MMYVDLFNTSLSVCNSQIVKRAVHHYYKINTYFKYSQYSYSRGKFTDTGIESFIFFLSQYLECLENSVPEQINLK